MAKKKKPSSLKSRIKKSQRKFRKVAAKRGGHVPRSGDVSLPDYAPIPD